MNNKKKSAPAVSIDIFAAAFCKLLKVSTGEIEIVMDKKGQEALVVFKDQRYKVSTKEAFRSEIELQLTDIDAAQSGAAAPRR